MPHGKLTQKDVDALPLPQGHLEGNGGARLLPSQGHDISCATALVHDTEQVLGTRRIAAIVLPELLSELATEEVRPPVQAAALVISSEAPCSRHPRQRTTTRSSQQDLGKTPPRPPGLGPLGLGATGMIAPLESSPRKSERAKSETPPTGIIVIESGAEGIPTEAAPLKPTAKLDAVNGTARRYGATPGLSIAEASALGAHLRIVTVTRGELHRALARVAEVALAFGTTAAIDPPQPAEAGLPDTVWLDITGVAHLFGGESALLLELASSVRALGHSVRVAAAAGPFLAQAHARWSIGSLQSRFPCDSPAARAALPIVALPLLSREVTWLAQLGVQTFGDLTHLPRAALVPRLEAHASLVIDLCLGHDPTPLVAYNPPRILIEEASFSVPITGTQPLGFALRGVAARLSARLAGRGEAAQALKLRLRYDELMARYRGLDRELVLHFDFASPLWREEDLQRVTISRLEHTRLEAPCVGLTLEAPLLTSAAVRQLELPVGPALSGCKGTSGLTVLLAELEMELGQGRVGVLSIADSHRPEGKSILLPVVRSARSRSPRSRSRQSMKRSPSFEQTYPRRFLENSPSPHSQDEAARGQDCAIRNSAIRNQKQPSRAQRLSLHDLSAAADRQYPTRLLPRPLPISTPFEEGAPLFIDGRNFIITRIVFEQRLEAVEWWTQRSTSRDYFRLYLQSEAGVAEVLLYRDRDRGSRFLQAIYD